jgi:glycosyltransferase involved in cell wall biosynthesis
MIICYVASDVVVPHHRGASTHVLEVSEHLVKRGHQVHVVCRRGEGQPKFEVTGGVNYYRLRDGIFVSNPQSSYRRSHSDGGKNFGLLQSIYAIYFTMVFPIYVGLFVMSLVRIVSADIIIERETSFGAGAIASYATGRPLVMEIVGPRYNSLAYRKASIILYYNEKMLRGSIDPSRLHRVSAAVNTSLFRDDINQRKTLRSRLGVDDFTVIGYSGSFADWQGVKDVVKAAQVLYKDNESVRFLMVGPYYENTLKLVEELGLKKYFIFSGQIEYEQVASYLNACDILVAPYNIMYSPLRMKYGIGSSLKIFEYMACGKAVIASRLYPISIEVQDDAVVFIPPGDINSLANAIRRLISTPAEVDRLGKVGEILVRENYSWEMFVKRLEGLFLQILVRAGQKSSGREYATDSTQRL